MREFKFFQKNTKPTYYVAVLAKRLGTFDDYFTNKRLTGNFDTIQTISPSGFKVDGHIYYHWVNSINDVLGCIFHDYVELHDAHEIPDYIELIRNLNNRRL